MRLITRDLHRAFPELDRFDDERCLRFVAAAKRGRRAAVGRLLLNLLLTGCVAGAIGSVGLLIMWFFWDAGGGASGPAAGGWRFAFGLFVLCLAIVAAGIASLVFRDQLLRKRVANFIFAKGKCPQCRYNLLGVRVPESLRINCPECGLELEVDAALTELAATGLGAAAGAPSDAVTGVDPSDGISVTASAHLPASAARQLHLIRAGEERTLLPKWFTPARRRKIIRTTLMLVALAVIIPTGVWGWRWYSLHAQAKRAAAMRVGLVGIDKLSESLNPPPDGAPDAWDYLDRITEIKAKVDQRVFDESPDLQAVLGTGERPDYDYLCFPDRLAGWETEREHSEERAFRAELARRYVREMGRAGAWDELDALAASRRAFRAQAPYLAGSPPDFGFVENQSLYDIARMTAARMAIADGEHDSAEYCRALRTGLITMRLGYRTPIMIRWLILAAGEDFVMSSLRHTVRCGVSAEWLGAIAEALDSVEAVPMPPFSAVIDGECEYIRDHTLYFFSDPSQVRVGWPRTPFNFSADGEARVGSLEENIAAIKTMHDLLLNDAQRTESARSSKAYMVLGDLATAQSAQSLQHGFRVMDQRRATFNGTIIMVAIERYRARFGASPPSLETLVPEFLASLPKDPYASDGRFGYRSLAAPTPDGSVPKLTGCVLYSVGPNGTLDRAESDKATPDESSGSSSRAEDDIVIHRVEP